MIYDTAQSQLSTQQPLGAHNIGLGSNDTNHIANAAAALRSNSPEMTVQFIFGEVQPRNVPLRRSDSVSRPCFSCHLNVLEGVNTTLMSQ